MHTFMDILCFSFAHMFFAFSDNIPMSIKEYFCSNRRDFPKNGNEIQFSSNEERSRA